MTNQHSTTGEREADANANAMREVLDRWDAARGKGGYPTALERYVMRKVLEERDALSAISRMAAPSDQSPDAGKMMAAADHVSGAAQMVSAASSEGEALATKWEAECDRTPYEPGKECTGRRVALTQCARELRAMLAARRAERDAERFDQRAREAALATPSTIPDKG